MHISTVNILEVVKGMMNITIAIKYEVTYGLSIDEFAFDLDPFQGQGYDHAQFRHRMF